MIIRIGNWLFHYRNALFPVVYLLLLLKSPPLLNDYVAAAMLGLVVALAGQSLRAMTIGLEYIIRGGRNRAVYAEKLVQGGLFAHCRNPLYVGNFLILVGVGIASNSVLFLATAVPFFALAYWAIVAAEENYLRGKFGQEFGDYCARVGRFVPRFGGLGRTLSGMQFNWRRLLTKEYGSAYLWMAAIVLVTLKNVWYSGDYQSHRPLVVGLWASLGIVTAGYLVARFLKKTGLVKAVRKPAA